MFLHTHRGRRYTFLRLLLLLKRLLLEKYLLLHVKLCGRCAIFRDSGQIIFENILGCYAAGFGGGGVDAEVGRAARGWTCKVNLQLRHGHCIVKQAEGRGYLLRSCLGCTRA